jgi:hypothetical protein
MVEPQAAYNVLRLKKDVLNNSSIMIRTSNRINCDATFNGIITADRPRISRTLVILIPMILPIETPLLPDRVA